MKADKIVHVLDHGYVELDDHFTKNGDLSVVNAARISFDKRSYKLNKQDVRLIHFLAKHGHTSPFRHYCYRFYVRAPLMVARQWWKYVVGSDHTMDAWNEVSRRYVTEELEFYIPNKDQWRSAASDKKQGSGGALVYPDEEENQWITDSLYYKVSNGIDDYDSFIADGMAPEQARLFLPAYAMYTTWVWTCSLQSLLHFLSQRLENDAQWEIQQYARATARLSLPLVDIAGRAILGDEVIDRVLGEENGNGSL